jgi:hypothetical protein
VLRCPSYGGQSVFGWRRQVTRITKFIRKRGFELQATGDR